MIRIPYGISDFATLIREQYYFVDRTPYLAWLEKLNEKYIFFLRPRRFGKSLWISILQYYYGLEHKESFQELFSKFYIGQHPTPLANSYLVLRLEFSRIDTTSAESTFEGFLSNVSTGVSRFLQTYRTYFSEADRDYILDADAPNTVLMRLFERVQSNTSTPKIYLLIDEYDHFANELVSFRFEDFRSLVSHNGFVRKFYETIKAGTGEGVVDRIFVTGVSPLTLDSLTSGFNVGSNLSTDQGLNEMMGFTEAEVSDILKGVGIEEKRLPAVLEDNRKWYNGYLFHPKGKVRLYNPDMVLYFAKEYQKNKRYPDTLLDTNIASDYGKIRKLFQVGGKEKENLAVLEDLILKGDVTAQLTAQFSFEKEFSTNDFISLLYYMGMLTIKEAQFNLLSFQVPNAVMQELYFDYFAQIIKEAAELPDYTNAVQTAVLTLAKHNDPRPLAELVSEALQQLSNRNWRNFSEGYVQAIFTAYLHLARLYYVKNEYETGQRYVDILVLRRPPYEPPYQFAFELKYLKKSEAHRLDEVTAAAREQLKGYLSQEELSDLPGLKGWVIVFVGPELRVVEEVEVM